MKKNSYEHLTNEELVNKHNQAKAALIGVGIVVAIALFIALYLYLNRAPEERKTAMLIPLFVMPVTMLPLLVIWSQLRKELASRNLR